MPGGHPRVALWVVATTLAPLQQALRIGRSALSCAGVLGGVSGFCSSGVQGPRSPGPNSTRFDPRVLFLLKDKLPAKCFIGFVGHYGVSRVCAFGVGGRFGVPKFLFL